MIESIQGKSARFVYLLCLHEKVKLLPRGNIMHFLIRGAVFPYRDCTIAQLITPAGFERETTSYMSAKREPLFSVTSFHVATPGIAALNVGIAARDLFLGPRMSGYPK